MSETVRVRFAPSPTGFLHLGNARAALFNWLWARRNKGTFILRIEDTDVERSTDEAVEGILDSLRWLGLDWDEGPFFQSERLEHYREHLERLREAGRIYPAFETKEELDAMREEAMRSGRTRYYNRGSLALEADEVNRRMESGVPFVWRLRVPDEGETVVPETLLGDGEAMRFPNADIDDFVLTRPGTPEKPGMPLYNFVCVVDDALMGITHVIRGADHQSNAARQVLLYEALGYPIPRFTHLPLILKANKKMKKRDADADPRFPVSVAARREIGYLPEATINFLSLLGWSFPGDREIFSRQEAIEAFTLERLVKSNANFDEDKYLHQNGVYIRSLDVGELAARVRPFLVKAGIDAGPDEARLRAIVELVRERCRLLTDFPPAMDYFFRAPEAFDPKGAKKVFEKDPEAAETLEKAAELLGNVEPFTAAAMEEAVRTYTEATGIGLGKVAQPVRLAVSGRTATPGLFETVELVGRDETVTRLRRAAEWLRAGAVPLATE